MITDDYQLMFEDVHTGQMIVLGGDEAFCSVRFDVVGSADLRTAERDMPSEDGIGFGREYLGKRTWTIQGAVKSGASGFTAGSSADAWDQMSMLVRAWDHNRARLNARDVVPLHFKRPGRETVLVYGRPERIDPDTSRSHAGFFSYQASFRQSDPKHYSETEQTMTIAAGTPYTGGILLKDSDYDSLSIPNAFRMPLTTSDQTTRDGSMIVGGDTATYPVIEFTGPVTNPTITLMSPDTSVTWSVSLLTTIDSGLRATIDTRPWARSILRSDGANIAGSLFGPRLAALTVPPGQSEFVYTASSIGGSSTCTIKLRNAWASL